MGAVELDSVRVFTAQGEAIGHIDLPERCANVCFGGRHRNRLFMAASHGFMRCMSTLKARVVAKP